MGVEGVFNGEIQEKSKVENVYFNLVDNDKFVTLELVDENGNHVICGNICKIDNSQVKLILFVMLTLILDLFLILMVT